MKFLSLAATAALSLALAAPASAAVFVNGGFDTGDLSGWTFSNGFVNVVGSADDSTGNAPFFGEHFTPTGGDWLAQIVAGVDVGTYSLLSQDFTLAQASTVIGDAAFLAFDEATYDDDAFVKIVKSTGEEFLFTRDILAVGDLGHTDWVHFTSSVLGAGSYTLVAGVRNSPNDPDNSYPSQLLVGQLQRQRRRHRPRRRARTRQLGPDGRRLRRARRRPARPAFSGRSGRLTRPGAQGGHYAALRQRLRHAISSLERTVGRSATIPRRTSPLCVTPSPPRWASCRWSSSRRAEASAPTTSSPGS
jgi:hypothetical protein